MEAAKTAKPITYIRRRPELTPCYNVLQNHLNTSISDRDGEGRPLPNYVIEEFDNFLEFGIPAYVWGGGKTSLPEPLKKGR
ncbi:MAG: hypothetical protein WCI18_11665 [Pseudomonadota bacterium]